MGSSSAEEIIGLVLCFKIEVNAIHSAGWYSSVIEVHAIGVRTPRVPPKSKIGPQLLKMRAEFPHGIQPQTRITPRGKSCRRIQKLRTNFALRGNPWGSH